MRIKPNTVRLNKPMIIAALFSITLPCEAKIPSIDDYNFGNGAVIRTQKNALEDGKAYVVQDNDKLQLSRFKSEIANVRTLSKSELWDDILIKIKQFESLRKPSFGYGNANSLKEVIGSEVDVRKLENMREDLSYLLGELEDFCISHRVIYFNKEDKKQVELIKEESGSSDDISIEETADLIQKIDVTLQDMLSLSSRL